MKISSQQWTFETISTELLIVGVQKHREQMKNWDDFPEFFGEEMNQFLRLGDISTDFNALTLLPISGQSVKRVLFVGIGEGKQCERKQLRHVFATVGKKLKQLRAGKFTIWVDSFVTKHLTEDTISTLAGEGIELGFYTFAHYKTTCNEPETYLDEIHFISKTNALQIAKGYERGHIYADAVNEARHYVNLPPNVLTPTRLAEYALELAKQYDFEVERLNKAQMQEFGMGGILAVNQGSCEEPCVITLKYQGKDKWEDVLGLVGKGVTYDTGGYSLKPRESMVGMKGDMGGAAAVLGAMKIIGQLRPKKNVVAVIGATDNMVSASAFKPDDVVTTYSGKTVEVLNTDAEGRLVLADAVTYAKQHGATRLIDVATLTGGVIVALGHDKTGALTNDSAFFTEFMTATAETDEFIWQLPLTESDQKRIRQSDIADLNNSPGRDGHMIFGGGFVGEFAEQTPWIHLDIAGTSEAQKAHVLGPKGATGVMVRTLAQYVLQA